MDDHVLSPLCEFFRKYGSDKSGWHLIAGEQCHNYGPAYHHLFKNRREHVKWVLELGINYGCSLRAWRDYFPNATIVGIDCNPSTMFSEDRIRTFVGDQYNANDLKNVLVKLDNPKFDLIVDDGSHERAHQIFSAQVLLPYLAKDGIYVVEDIYPDCKPELVGDPIVAQRSDFRWRAVYTGFGIGVAQCGCGCGTGENLLVIRHV